MNMSSKHNFFITGIGTDVGKTVVSAILVEALQADYWKPIQAGDIANSDAQKVKKLISNQQSIFHKESYIFQTAASPHIAAANENCTIDIAKINMPITQNNLIIEGAGGLLVPLNNDFLMIDFIEKSNAKVIVVVNDYLGSINHTLLSFEAVEHRGIEVFGYIINGKCSEEIKATFLHFIKYPLLGIVPYQENINKNFILEQSLVFKQILSEK